MQNNAKIKMPSLSSLPASLEPLLHRAPLPPLVPSKPFDPSLRASIDGLAKEGASPAVRASLHLLNDDIERAHDVAQADEQSMTSNVCHAICELLVSDRV